MPLDPVSLATATQAQLTASKAYAARRQFTGLEVSGASYTSGIGSYDSRHGFASALAADLGVPLFNHAIGGAVAAWDKTVINSAGGGGYANVLYDVQPLQVAGGSTGAPYLSPRSLSLLAYWFNDGWKNNGASPGWTNSGGPFISAMRLIIARHRAAVTFRVTNPIFSAPSNITLTASGYYGDGSNWWQSTASPSSMTVTVPSDFHDSEAPGSSFDIWGAVWAASAGTITFTVNGVAQPSKTINLATISNATGGTTNGWVARFENANPGDVIVATATYTAGQVAWGGAWVESSNGPHVIVQGTPHVPIVPATYGWASQAALFADIDSANTAQEALIAEFSDGWVEFEDIVGVMGSIPFGTSGSLYAPDSLHPSQKAHDVDVKNDLKRIVQARPVAPITAPFPPRRSEGPFTLWRTVTAVSYAMGPNDQYLGLNAAAVQTALLPDAASICPNFAPNSGTATLLVIKDEGANAGTYAKTLAGINGQLIDGQPSYVINTNGGGVILASNGFGYGVIAAWGGPKAWETIRAAQGVMAASSAAGNWVISPSLVSALIGGNGQLGLIYIDASDYPVNAEGVASKIRLTGLVATDAVAQTANFTFNLVPVTGWGGASGVAPEITTVGAAVASVTINAPGATTETSTESATANMPASGWYVVELANSAAVAASGPVMVGYEIEAQRA